MTDKHISRKDALKKLGGLALGSTMFFPRLGQKQKKGQSFPAIIKNRSAAYKNENRWSSEKAWRWYKEQPWILGVNYIPHNAINYTAMWDKTSFSPKLIDRELSLAQGIGFNAVRVVMQYLVWEDDPAYFKKTFGQFLKICDKYSIRAIPAFFDDCVFGVNVDPILGEQLAPLKGWYAWYWSPSPGHSRVIEKSCYRKLKKYVQDVMASFKDDNRILMWDLYNEPTNSGLGDKSLPLLKKDFQWAREVNPSQPLTVARFSKNEHLNDIIFANADIITFHDYGPKKELQQTIKRLKKQGRPLICTEWLNRPLGSTVKDNLPVFYENKIGAISWGLVNGKTQTNLPWGHRPDDGPYRGLWQHDLYHSDFTPYHPKELELFKKYIRLSKERSIL
jgi:hypothetical protein